MEFYCIPDIDHLQPWKNSFTHPQDTHFADLLPPWTLPPPHHVWWSMLFSQGEKWSSQSSTLCIIFFCQYFKSLILKLDMATAIILDIFVLDCSFLNVY